MRQKDDYENQRLKLLILLQIFQQYTDATHYLSATEIIDMLEQKGVDVEKRTFQTSLKDLIDAQYDIRRRRVGNRVEYALVDREFQLAELKLLAASVQSSRFLTEQKARELTKKLKSLTSIAQGNSLNSGMLAYGRIRSMNDSIYNNLDNLNSAIEQRLKIKFKYFDWDSHAKKHFRHDGAFYSVSPYLLVSQNDKIYMVGHDDSDELVKNFRVDKMENIRLTDDPAVLKDCLVREKPSEYVAGMFNMYGGAKMIPVTLSCANSISNVIVDTFGRNNSMIPQADGTFHITVKVSPSAQFYGWVLALHPQVKILAPQEQVEEIKKLGRSILEDYR